MLRSAFTVAWSLTDRWPGRAIAFGIIAKLAVLLARAVVVSPVVETIDAVATLILIAGGAYFLFGALALSNRRLLWRVRRKLIISYIFIGVVPTMLIAVFFLLGGLLLFSNFSSYLVQSRLSALTARAGAVASATLADVQRSSGRDLQAILDRRVEALSGELSGLSVAVVPASDRCVRTASADATEAPSSGPLATAGPWAHVEPPQRVPAWVSCSGFAGMLAYEVHGEAASSARAPTIVVDGEPARPAHALARAVASTAGSGMGWTVVVDVPVVESVRRGISAETGVELTGVQRVPSGAAALPGKAGADSSAISSELNDRIRFPSIFMLEFSDWSTGETGRLSIATALSIVEIYDRISAAQGTLGDRSFGQGLLVALIVIGVLFLVIEGVALGTGMALARSITGSVHQLFLGTGRAQHNDFTYKIPVTAQDQLGELARSFNSMTTHIEALLIRSAEKERLEEELRIAHEIQMSLLPQGPLLMQGLSVTALCVPAREVGGDYYDFLPLSDRSVGVLVADVSGKGTSAALYMAELKGLVASLSRIHRSPRGLLIAANRIIAEHLDARSFITMTYAVFDFEAHTITFARAGHTPLIHLPAQDRGTGDARILVPNGLVLGLKIDDGQLFERLLEEQTLPLQSGDLYVFFTDGISEAMNEADDCFGVERLSRLVAEHAHLPADELRERVVRDIAAFVGDAPQHDDMTMILLRIEDDPAVESHPTQASGVERVAEIQ
jgi:sigma-B regulation protein RsbU (phosphoserine phosphatase)